MKKSSSLGVIAGKVRLTLEPRAVRSYRLRGRTAANAADSVVARAEGEGYLDTIPNRVALLSEGDTLKRVETALGMHGTPIPGEDPDPPTVDPDPPPRKSRNASPRIETATGTPKRK